MKFNLSFLYALVALLPVLVPHAGYSATFTVQAENNGVFCATESGSAPVFGECLIESAPNSLLLQGRSNLGSLGVNATLYNEETTTSARGNVVATINDGLTFNVQSGRFVIPVDIAGQLFAKLNGSATGQTLSRSRVQFLFGQTTLYSRALATTATGTNFIQGESVGLDGVQQAFINIVDGKGILNAGLFASVDCLALQPGADCLSSAFFFSSARFLGGTVLDENGLVVANATVQSSSGFDYLTGVQPHLVSTVPLPATIWLLIASVGGLASLRIKRGYS